MKEKEAVNIIGAGLAGLSAAMYMARAGIRSNLISSQPSERAQSVLAEGGINAALNTMGEEDSPEAHFVDTMVGGCFLESESAVRNLTEYAPDIVRDLIRLGVPFQSEKGKLILRHFGGQKKRRTAYAKSSTGKVIMTALIDEVRKYEAEGLVTRYPHHDLTDLLVSGGALRTVEVRDQWSGQNLYFPGITILCTGGLNGFFEGMTTGTTANTGDAAAIAFASGVEFRNLEFIQYHPTTVVIADKRMLLSEAARGEGGRLFIMRDGRPWYFMEEKYPELGNLMPRDVVSREMYFVREEEGCRGEIFLDMTGLEAEIWETRLSDLRLEIIDYLKIDPKENPVPVSPGIHFFMGGIGVDDRHRTNIPGLLAAGEAACKYHGANRLGGNSMLGAIFGGRVAAGTAVSAIKKREIPADKAAILKMTNYPKRKESVTDCDSPEGRKKDAGLPSQSADPLLRQETSQILIRALGIVRTPERMKEAEEKLETLYAGEGISRLDSSRLALALAMVRSALQREESRGAHYRTDYPEPRGQFLVRSHAQSDEDGVRVWFAEEIEEEGLTL